MEKLTANRFLGVAVGAGITAVIQSSSATTVMVVGFVNSGMMAPMFAFWGVAMVVFKKKPRAHHIGQILAGLGILFIQRKHVCCILNY